MDKKNFVFFSFLCAVVGLLYLIMHYQVRSAEELMSNVSLAEPVKDAAKKDTTRKAPVKIKPRTVFVEPIEVDDGLTSISDDANMVVTD